jgi:RNA polymerase sigma-70 factor (ECF subfamily)
MRGDAEIVREVLAGDQRSFAQLVARHEKAAWATAWRVLRDEHAASDAVQEGFLQAFGRLKNLREQSSFGAWLLRIVRREAVRLARQRSRHAARSISEGADDLADAEKARSSLQADRERMLAAVARLPEHERVVVSLRYLEGHAVTEISVILGRPIGTVTKQLSRALERLRGKLKEVRR